MANHEQPQVGPRMHEFQQWPTPAWYPKSSERGAAEDSRGVWLNSDFAAVSQATTTGILPMRPCHSRGPVWWTDSPSESTATVTGMS